MMEREGNYSGFRVLDGVALVIGAAVASVHIRSVIRDDLNGFGWVLVWLTFTWVAVTAAGPFMLLARRFAQRVPGYPKTGDGLWALLGLPWLATAILRSTPYGSAEENQPLFALWLSVGLGLASTIALGVVWNRWVTVSPEQAARTAATPWTNRLGLVLAIAWPVQCGIALVVLS